MLIQRGGRILSILGVVCSFLATRFYSYYLIFYSVWAEPRLLVLMSKTMGGGGVVMPRSSPQHKQFSGQLGLLVFVLDVCLY